MARPSQGITKGVRIETRIPAEVDAAIDSLVAASGGTSKATIARQAMLRGLATRTSTPRTPSTRTCSTAATTPTWTPSTPSPPGAARSDLWLDWNIEADRNRLRRWMDAVQLERRYEEPRAEVLSLLLVQI